MSRLCFSSEIHAKIIRRKGNDVESLAALFFYQFKHPETKNIIAELRIQKMAVGNIYPFGTYEHDSGIISVVGEECFSDNTEILVENDDAEVLATELDEFHRPDAFI